MRISTNIAIAVGTLCLVVIMVLAVADQEFSWWVLPFGFIFGTSFLGVLTICFLNHREDRHRRSAQVAYPDQPWMWDARWRSSVMTSRNVPDFWGNLAFTVILGAFATIGAATLIQGLSDGNLWVLLNLIPIAFAVYFGRRSHFAWRTLRTFRDVSVFNESIPAWVGGKLTARVTTSGRLSPEHTEVWLEHIKSVTRIDNDGTSFEKVVDRKISGRIEGTGQNASRISLDIPPDGPATSWSDEGPECWWDLVIDMTVAGDRVLARYEVPVADPAIHRPTDV